MIIFKAFFVTTYERKCLNRKQKCKGAKRVKKKLKKYRKIQAADFMGNEYLIVDTNAIKPGGLFISRHLGAVLLKHWKEQQFIWERKNECILITLVKF